MPAARILVVDDQPAIHRDFRAILGLTETDNEDELGELEQELFGTQVTRSRKHRFDIAIEVDSAYQGQDAITMLARAQELARPYSMAFVDIRMPPGIDGIETVKRLWQLEPSLEIVLCSGYSDHSWNDLTQHLGNAYNLLFLRKPVEVLQIRQMVASILQRSQSRSKLLQALERTDTSRDYQRQQIFQHWRRFRAILDLIGDRAWVFTPDGRVSWRNEAAEIFGDADSRRAIETAIRAAVVHTAHASEAAPQGHAAEPASDSIVIELFDVSAGGVTPTAHLIPLSIPAEPSAGSANDTSLAPMERMYMCVCRTMEREPGNKP